MQTPKESTRISILDAAKAEFLEVGYEKASMRKIAKKANVSTSNIYNYFIGKEDILTTLLEPVLAKVSLGIELVSAEDHLEKRLGFSYELIKRRFNVVLDYVDQNRDLFDLLIFRSQGSQYIDFLNDTASRLTNINLIQLEHYKRSKNLDNIHANEFFVRTLINFFLNIFVDMIKYKITKAEMLEMEDNFLKFLHYGSKAILLDQSQ
jgi:AcrR family transcriptional regulator